MRQIIPASFCTVKSHRLLSLIERTKLKYSFSLMDQSTAEKMKTPTELFFFKGICISILSCYPISHGNFILNAWDVQWIFFFFSTHFIYSPFTCAHLYTNCMCIYMLHNLRFCLGFNYRQSQAIKYQEATAQFIRSLWSYDNNNWGKVYFKL